MIQDLKPQLVCKSGYHQKLVSVSLCCFLQGSSSSSLRSSRKKKPCHIPILPEEGAVEHMGLPWFSLERNITSTGLHNLQVGQYRRAGLCVLVTTRPRSEEKFVCLYVQKRQCLVSVPLREPTKEPMQRSFMWDSGFTCHSFPGTCSFPLQVLEEMRPFPSPSSMLSLVGGPFSGKAPGI